MNNNPYNTQNTTDPLSPKVGAVVATGPVSVVLVWVAKMYGLELPPEVAVSFAIILAGLAGWYTKGK